jgi:cystathionine beta-lyase
MSDSKNYHLATRLLHAGQAPDPTTGAVIMPIYATSTYAQATPGVEGEFLYSRSQNPTRFAYERCVADLESGKRAFAFASGLAATSAVLELLNVGDHVLVSHNVYGGTHRLFQKVKKRSANLDISWVDFSDINQVRAAIKPNTKFMWLETPTNPMMKLADLTAVARLAKEHNILAAVDNTFASPLGQRPLEHGFPLVVHSATKYLNGHSDMIGGVVVVGDHHPELIEQLQFMQNSLGAVPSPFDCFLALRGVKTLGLRLKAQSENAQALAQWLEHHPHVAEVYYPGLTSHPQHQLAKNQMHYFGGVVGVKLRADLEQTKKMLGACKLFTLAVSLGSVESLIEHPATMTHKSVSPEERAAIGITDNLIRLSVGIEHVDDLKHDLAQALAAME